MVILKSSDRKTHVMFSSVHITCFHVGQPKNDKKWVCLKIKYIPHCIPGLIIIIPVVNMAIAG